MPSKIKKRGENSYLLTVSNGTDGAGKRICHTKTVTASSPTEARKLYALFVAEVERGQVSHSGKMTLSEFYEYFVENYAKTHQAPKSIDSNAYLFKRIGAALGHKRIDQIEPKHLLAFYANLRQPIKIVRKKTLDATAAPEFLSPNTIHKYHVFLHTLFEKAVKWQFLPYNVAEKVEAPKKVRPQQVIYDEETTGRFLLLLEEESLKHQSMALLPLATGMRRGEALGLQWKHLDLDGCLVTIAQTAQYLPHLGTFTKDPKTETSKRQITIPRSLALLLRKYKAEQMQKRLELGLADNGGKWQGAGEPDEDFIFTTWDGKQAHPDSINTWLKGFINRTGLPHLTPKGFRHMAATYLIKGNTDLRTVAGKLGHSNSTTTQIVYSHLVKSAETETAEKMDSFFQSAIETAKSRQSKKQTAK